MDISNEEQSIVRITRKICTNEPQLTSRKKKTLTMHTNTSNPYYRTNKNSSALVKSMKFNWIQLWKSERKRVPVWICVIHAKLNYEATSFFAPGTPPLGGCRGNTLTILCGLKRTSFPPAWGRCRVEMTLQVLPALYPLFFSPPPFQPVHQHVSTPLLCSWGIFFFNLD